jgi:5'-nucleotidase
VEIDAMNRMKYDAGTLGNHEFDNGIDTLAAVLKNALFPMISSNYKLDNTSLFPLVKRYVVIQKAGLRIGIMALDVNPESLIFEKNYRGLVYQDPIEKANEVSSIPEEK